MQQFLLENTLGLQQITSQTHDQHCDVVKKIIIILICTESVLGKRHTFCYLLMQLLLPWLSTSYPTRGLYFKEYVNLLMNLSRGMGKVRYLKSTVCEEQRVVVADWFKSEKTKRNLLKDKADTQKHKN